MSEKRNIVSDPFEINKAFSRSTLGAGVKTNNGLEPKTSSFAKPMNAKPTDPQGTLKKISGLNGSDSKVGGMSKNVIAKFDYGSQNKPTLGRKVAGTTFGWAHGAVAGKKGRKLGAAGSSIGHTFGGSVVGGVAGSLLTRGKTGGALAGNVIGGLAGSNRAVKVNQRKGRLKPQL